MQHIDQQKDTTAVFGCQIRETPDIAQTYRGTGCRQDEADLAGKGTSVIIFVIHSLNSPIKNCRKQNKCNIEIRKIQYETV